MDDKTIRAAIEAAARNLPKSQIEHGVSVATPVIAAFLRALPGVLNLGGGLGVVTTPELAQLVEDAADG